MDILKEINRPFEKDFFLEINVTKIFTDVDGEIINPPDFLNIDYPVYFFGKWDRLGANRIATIETPLKSNEVKFLRQYVADISYDPTGFSGQNNVNTFINRGDIVYVYSDNILDPDVFTYIILSVNNKSLASITDGLPCSGFFLKSLKLDISQIPRKDLSINFGVLVNNIVGDYDFDLFSPSKYFGSLERNNFIIDIPFNLELTPFTALTYYISKNTNKFSLNFKIIKK